MHFLSQILEKINNDINLESKLLKTNHLLLINTALQGGPVICINKIKIILDFEVAELMEIKEN